MTKVKVGLGCLLELLKKDPIVKIVSELPSKETAELNFIYLVPKDNAGQDKRAYVLRPDRSGYDAIDLSPQVIDVVGDGLITVNKEVHNENGDVTFTVTTSPSFQAVLDSLTAKDKEVETTLGTLGEKVDLVGNKAQELDTRVKVLEAKEDSDKQTLAIDGHKLSISNGNEVDLPQYDDTELNDALDDLEDKVTDVREELADAKENFEPRIKTLEDKQVEVTAGTSNVTVDKSQDGSTTKFKVNVDDSYLKEAINHLGDGVNQAMDYTEQVKKYVDSKADALTLVLGTSKADSDAKNTALTNRVNVLEEAKPVVENKLTEIEAKNTAQDEKITALENRTDNFINNVAVSKKAGKVKLTYSRVDGSSSEVEFEDSDTVTLAYDDEPLKTRIKALENKEDKDTIYDDSAVRGKITALENKVEGNKTAQDGKNTELENRIQALEVKPDKDTVYDDTALAGRVTALEGKEDKDTIYDDTAISGRITQLETSVTANKQAQDAKNAELDAKDKELEGKVTALENKVDNDNQKLTLEDNTLSISGGNAVTLPKYDDSALKASVEELKNKDTELANKDKELTNEINTLKAKTDNFVSGVSVNKEGNKVKLTYSYVDGSNKEVEFEDSDTVTLAYDDTAVKERLTALEAKEDKDTIYNDAPLKERITALENKPEVRYLFNKGITDASYSQGDGVIDISQVQEIADFFEFVVTGGVSAKVKSPFGEDESTFNGEVGFNSGLFKDNVRGSHTTSVSDDVYVAFYYTESYFKAYLVYEPENENEVVKYRKVLSLAELKGENPARISIFKGGIEQGYLEARFTNVRATFNSYLLQKG